jgi:hypothetical protein
MTEARFTIMFDILAGTGRTLVIIEDELRELVEADERHQSIGAILDPTLFRQTMWSKTYAANVAIAKATLAYIAELRTWDAAHTTERERKEIAHG